MSVDAKTFLRMDLLCIRQEERLASHEASNRPEVPNKPMVPTAPASPIVNPLRPLRRHIGQSLDSAQGSGRRPTKEQQLGHGQGTMNGDQRTTSGDNEHPLIRAAT